MAEKEGREREREGGGEKGGRERERVGAERGEGERGRGRERERERGGGGEKRERWRKIELFIFPQQDLSKDRTCHILQEGYQGVIYPVSHRSLRIKFWALRTNCETQSEKVRIKIIICEAVHQIRRSLRDRNRQHDQPETACAATPRRRS